MMLTGENADKLKVCCSTIFSHQATIWGMNLCITVMSFYYSTFCLYSAYILHNNARVGHGDSSGRCSSPPLNCINPSSQPSTFLLQIIINLFQPQLLNVPSPPKILHSPPPLLTHPSEAIWLSLSEVPSHSLVSLGWRTKL